MKQQPLYEMIYREILGGIEDGSYGPGDRIPSEKELSEKYRVSRITSKKALEMLAEEGKIIRMAGKGSFVAGKERRGEWEKDSRAGRAKKLVGVIMDGFGPSFGCELLVNLELECRRQGFLMLLRCTNGNMEEEVRALDELLSAGADGILIMCVHDENYNSRVLRLVVEHFPVVTLDRQLKGIPVPFVGTDNEAAAKELADWLLDRGFHSICLATHFSRDTSTIEERQNGLRRACHDRGMIADESLWITDLCATLPGSRSEENRERDAEHIMDFLERHPQIDSFFAVEYGIAEMIYRCLCVKKLQDRYPVVCFDSPGDVMPGRTFTHVRQDEKTIGETGVRLLAEAMEKKEAPKKVLVPYRIVEAEKR
ncbi:MAG TPA: substrate-binding domain-containing protein [Candidatus Eisenbergiella intestinipullorum]|nr:substrate-binding domain-containing protein [Candidatus Eisenbergiella intestinipullorum]